MYNLYRSTFLYITLKILFKNLNSQPRLGSTFSDKYNLVHIVAYRPVAGQGPRNERVLSLLCNRRVNKQPYLSNVR
jgi:hypothetical protein